jgi:hypothetical protein
MIYDFNEFTEKHKSREETIVNAYRTLFNKERLVGDYATLCANQTDNNGALSKGSELNQLLKEEFLTPEQFHGVDFDKETIEQNKQLNIANWHCNDVYLFLTDNIKKYNFTAVNLDTVFYSKTKAANLLADTLLLFTDNTSGECLVSLNVMINNSYETHTVDAELIEAEETKFVEELSKNYSYKCAVKDGGWVMDEKCYLYSSTNKTVMCTYLFYRK